jgi:hypothetical protein
MLAGVLLALALGPPPDAAPAGEFVRAVRVEAEQRERLLSFVGIVLGQPLDHEAVRRAVELMYATGRFDDVVVELVREEGE